MLSNGSCVCKSATRIGAMNPGLCEEKQWSANGALLVAAWLGCIAGTTLMQGSGGLTNQGRDHYAYTHSQDTIRPTFAPMTARRIPRIPRIPRITKTFQ